MGQLKDNLSAPFHPLLQKNDFNSNMKILKQFQEALNNQFDEFIDVLDLIIKWIFTILFDNKNTKLCKLTLSLIHNILEELVAQEY